MKLTDTICPYQDGTWLMVTLVNRYPITYEIPIDKVTIQLIIELITVQIWDVNRWKSLTTLNNIDYSIQDSEVEIISIVEIKNGQCTYKIIELTAGEQMQIIAALQNIRRRSDRLLDSAIMPLASDFISQINMALSNHGTRCILAAHQLGINALILNPYTKWFSVNLPELIWISKVARHGTGNVPRMLVLKIYEIVLCTANI